MVFANGQQVYDVHAIVNNTTCTVLIVVDWSLCKNVRCDTQSERLLVAKS